MSDRVVKPVNDANKKIIQTPWLAHWRITSCDAAGETVDPNSSRDKELENVTRNGEDLTEGLEGSCMPIGGLNMIKARTSEIGFGIIKVSSKSIGNGRKLGSLFKDGQGRKYEVDKGKAALSAVSKRSRNAKRVLESNGRKLGSLFKDGQGKKYEVDKGKTALSAVSKRSRNAKRVLECEECYEDGHSADLVQPDNSVKACFKQNITCDHYLSTYGYNRLAKMQKLQNIVDASEGMPEGCSRFSKMTNGLLITTKIDVNAFKENDMVRKKRIIANTKGNISNEPLSGHGKQQVILQPLNSDSEVKENVGDAKAFKTVIRNESSNSAASNKALNLESHVTSSSNVASSRKVLPALPHAATSSEAKSKSNFSLEDLANADPGERWVKRLKLSSPNPSAQGTKSSNFATCQVKISKLFGWIPKISTTTPTLEKSAVLGTSEEKGKEVSVSSDAWIKRWLYTKCEAEPQSSKVSLEEQLPSIAAMALMGKALAYLQPCEFRKRGSCTVWNIKAC